MAKCNSCGAPIEWITMKTGKRMPVNIMPSPYWAPCPGETMVMEINGGKGEVVVLPTDRPFIQLFVPHWATCPDAATWRKKGGAK